MKRLVIIMLSAVCMTAAVAQDKVGATIGCDFVSQYIWRGQKLGNVSLQPTLGIDYKGLSLTSWGSVGFDSDDAKELDFTLAYEWKGFNVGLTDYWFSEGNYFHYGAHETTHVWEANLGYDFGFLSVQWFTNFGGNDGTTSSGKRAYSSYFELPAPFRLGGLDWEATFGAVPYQTSFYDTNGFAVTNISLKATKDFVIKQKWHLPVFAGLTGNPRAEKLYFIFGTSFSI